MSIAMRATFVALTMFAAPTATAQVISVPQPSLTAGQGATVEVMDPDNADSVVTVTVDNGSQSDPESVEIQVQLDANGVGAATWMVPDSPNWWGARFSLPGAGSVMRTIVPRPRDGDPEKESPVPVTLG